VGGSAHRSRALAEDACGGGTVQADDDPQEHGLGLVPRQPADQFQRPLGGQGLQGLVMGAVPAGQVQYVLFGPSWPGPYALAAQMVQRPVPGDGRGPPRRRRPGRADSRAGPAARSGMRPRRPSRRRPGPARPPRPIPRRTPVRAGVAVPGPRLSSFVPGSWRVRAVRRAPVTSTAPW
jgi:hypothetical protein